MRITSPPGGADGSLTTVTLADDFTSGFVDNGSAMTGPATESGGYITIPLAGSQQPASLVAPDFEDAAVCYAVAPIQKANGGPLTGDDRYITTIRLDVFTSRPVPADNVLIWCGISNSATPGAVGAYGKYFGFETGTGVHATLPRITITSISNGVTAARSNGGVISQVWGVQGNCIHDDTATLQGSRQQWVINSDDSLYLTTGFVTDAYVLTAGTWTGQQYLVLAAHRILNTDTDPLNVTCRLRYVKPYVWNP